MTPAAIDLPPRKRVHPRPRASACALALACLAALLIAAPAAAQTTDPTTGGSTSDGRATTLTAATPQHVGRGRRVRLSGSLLPARAHRKVLVQSWRRGRWRHVIRLRTAADGGFGTRWRTRSLRPVRLRVVFRGDARGARSTYELPVVTVYRKALASWYGPGFFGRTTACGQTYDETILGVAHRRLPCGTRVTLRYRRRSLTVPVIDRGPYVPPREFDLSFATKEELGFDGVRILWSTR